MEMYQASLQALKNKINDCSAALEKVTTMKSWIFFSTKTKWKPNLVSFLLLICKLLLECLRVSKVGMLLETYMWCKFWSILAWETCLRFLTYASWQPALVMCQKELESWPHFLHTLGIWAETLYHGKFSVFLVRYASICTVPKPTGFTVQNRKTEPAVLGFLGTASGQRQCRKFLELCACPLPSAQMPTALGSAGRFPEY